MPLTDNDILDFGNKFKGKKLIDVPAKYLLWMHENVKMTIWNAPVLDYIKDNLEVLRKDTK